MDDASNYDMGRVDIVLRIASSSSNRICAKAHNLTSLNVAQVHLVRRLYNLDLRMSLLLQHSIEVLVYRSLIPIIFLLKRL